MPNKDGTGNALDGIRNILLGLIFIVAPIVLPGLFLEHLRGWQAVIMGLGPFIGVYIFAGIATKGVVKNRLIWALGAAVAGLIFYIAI